MTDNKFLLVRQGGKGIGPKPPLGESKLSLTPDAKPTAPRATLVLHARAPGGKMRTARKAGKAKGSTVGNSLLPPEVKEPMEYRFRGYFFMSTAQTSACTRQSLGAALGFVALTSTTGVMITTSFRIRRIRVWPTENDLTTRVVWADASGTAEGALTKDENSIRPTVQGTTVPQCLEFKPPKGSIHAMWQTPAVNGTDTLLNLSTGGNALILFEADVVQVWNNATSGLAPASVGAFTGATAGHYYRYSLDNTTSGNVIKSLTASVF